MYPNCFGQGESSGRILPWSDPGAFFAGTGTITRSYPLVAFGEVMQIATAQRIDDPVRPRKSLQLMGLQVHFDHTLSNLPVRKWK